MNKKNKISILIGMILIILGFAITIIAYIKGARYNEIESIFLDGPLYSFFHKNNNNELDKDALIWEEERVNNNKQLFEQTITEQILYEFDAINISSIYIDLSNITVNLQRGDTFLVKSKSFSINEINCRLQTNNKLIISNKKNNKSLFYFDNTDNNELVLCIPDNKTFDLFSLQLKNCTFNSTEIKQKVRQSTINNINSAVNLNYLYSEKTIITQKDGILILNGYLLGNTKITCESGQMNINLNPNSINIQKESINNDLLDYSYSVDPGMGEITINGSSLSLSGESKSLHKKQNHLSLKCGTGTIILHY